MKFDKYIEFNDLFQNSINLSLDIKNPDKVNTYIPTTRGNHFLSTYLDDVLIENRNKSSMIIAPYGKGKSHAILVLLNLLYKTDFESIQIFVNNICQVDSSFKKRIHAIQSKKYLPVIIDHTKSSLRQTLMNAMNRSLKKFDLNDVKLSTDFTQAADRIISWKENYPDVYEKFINELWKDRITIDIFLKKLECYDEKSLQVFSNIHKKILAGVEFVPNNSLDVIDYYNEIKQYICNHYGYNGIYIVFDEFSKFIESRDKNYVSDDMKIIQDLSELCNVSTDNSMYLMLVLHKPINTYRSLNSDIRNSFKGIEGRISTYYFETTIKNSFELVFNAMKKNKNYLEISKENKLLNKKIIKSLKNIPAFQKEFDESYIENQLVDNCYPLSPTTLYLLIRISEKIAQNERTLFTFLIKKSSYSLPEIITEDYSYRYILPSAIFDYFQRQLLEDIENVNIQRITMSALTAMNYVENEIEIEMIKSLALILIINEKDYFPASEENLATSVLLSLNDGRDVLKSLVNKNIIIRRRNGLYEFKINMNKNVQNEIDNLIHTKFTKIRIAEELNKYNKTKFIYPRLYNINKFITRYFKIEYIEEDAFMALENLDRWFINEDNDGIIFNIVRKKNNNYNIIKDKVLQMNNNRLLVIYPQSYYNFDENIKRILAANNMLMTYKSEDKLLYTEINQLYNDFKLDLEETLNYNYSFYSGNCYLINSYNNDEINNVQRTLSKERILGEIFTQTFSNAPIVNLEMLNRHNVKPVYKKARIDLNTKILKGYLDDEDCINTKTSPVDTIINCLLVETGLKPFNADKVHVSGFDRIIDEINDFFSLGRGKFLDIYITLKNPPYGIRKGILPVLIALQLAKLSRKIIIYYNDIETTLDADLLERINENPESFSFVIDNRDDIKEQYINDLISIFNLNIENNRDYVSMMRGIQEWYHQLPKFTKFMIGKDNQIKTIQFKKLKKYFSSQNINPSDFIMQLIPDIFNSDNYDFIEDLKEMKLVLENYISYFCQILKRKINGYFEVDEDTNLIKSCRRWIFENKDKLNTLVLPEGYKQFINIYNKNINDEIDLIYSITFYMTGIYIDDWTEHTIDIFDKNMENLVSKSVEERDNVDQITISVDGKQIIKNFKNDFDDSTELIENIIVDAIDDFGDSISSEQKIALLVKVIRKYL